MKNTLASSLTANLCLLLGLITTHTAFANDTHKHEHSTQNQSAHVHGEAELEITQDNKQILIEFKSPSIDMVGFEHTAKNKAQQDKLKAVENTLKNNQKLLVFNTEAQCQQTKATTDISDLTAQKSKESHSDIKVSYFFTCAQPQDLKSIQVNLFKQFRSLHAIEAQWIVHNKQGAKALTPKQSTIFLK
jgi:hypothetical protein